MGNFCSDLETQVSSERATKKLRVSEVSTTSNMQTAIEKIKKEQTQIVQLLSSSKQISARQSLPQIQKLSVISEIGKGGQAEVYSINIEVSNPQSIQCSKFNQNTLALKIIDIKRQKKNKKSIELATQLLIEHECPFLVKALFCLKSNRYYYECMHIAEGGDLASFLQTTTGKGDAFRKLGDQGIRMVLAGIILGLQYIHNKNFIYCDLKTENVLIGKDGYPLLTDFQLLKNQKNSRSSQYQGTPTIVGPEVLTNSTFDKSMDLWSLGILIYNLVYNQVPYSVKEITDQNFIYVCKKNQNRYRLKKKKSSFQLSDLINKLLMTEPKERIGYNSLTQLKQHQFFRDFDWEKYARKQLKNPLANIVEKFSLRKFTRSKSLYI